MHTQTYIEGFGFEGPFSLADSVNGRHNGQRPPMAIKRGPDTAQRVTKIGLMAVFGGAVLLFSRKKQLAPLTVIDWVTLGLALVRLGRMTAHDLIAEPFRAPVAKTQHHDHYGDMTEAKHERGPLASLGQLATCPICAGTWWAAVLTYGLSLAPNFTRVFIRIQALAGIVEVGDALIEALCWGAAAARRFTGKGL